MKSKKLFIILLVLAFGGFSAACNGNGDDEDTQTDAQQDDIPAEADADVTPDPTPDPTEEDPGEDPTVDPTEDPTGDPTGDPVEDMEEEEAPSFATVTGMVWSYSLMMETTYYTEPADGITVSATGEGVSPVDFTDSTLATNCDDWWSTGEPFDCGRFAIDELPLDTAIMLRAESEIETDPDVLSKIFNTTDAHFQAMILPTQQLIDTMLASWSVTQAEDDGMGIVLLVESINPDPIYDPADEENTCPGNEEACMLYGFIGGATVEATPSMGEDLVLVYFDSETPASTERTSTDGAQSLIFAMNIPPRAMEDPYTITVTSDTHTFEAADFAVEAGAVTYILMIGTPD